MNAATRAVIERLVAGLDKVSNHFGLTSYREAQVLIAEARALLEEPASEDACIKATLECVRECERECQKTGVGSCVMVNSILNPAHPDVCNAENCKSIKAMIEAAKGDTNADV